MIIALPRGDRELNDPISQLEARYQESGRNIKKAWEILTPEELSFVVTEVNHCLEDPSYYLRNYHFIRTKKLVLQTIYPLFDSQAMIMEEFMRQYNLHMCIRILVLKARQQGATTLCVSLLLWLTLFHPSAHSLSMSDEGDRVEVNFTMARLAHSLLPWWMRPELRYNVKPVMLGFDRAREEDRKESSGLESMMYFESANQPSGAAYSKSLYGAHMAELGRYRRADAITEGILGSLVELPRSIGFGEGTGRGRNSVWHKLWKASVGGKFRWTPLFLEWFREPGYSIPVPANFKLTNEEEAIAGKVKAECNYSLSNGQFAWYRMKEAEFAATGDPEKIHQEFPYTPEEAFISHGKTAFPKDRLRNMQMHFCRPPRWRGEISLNLQDNKTPELLSYELGQFMIWEYPKPGSVYKCGGDIALGIEGGDYSAAVVYCVPEDITLPIRQVARWRGHMPPTEFARVMAAIGYLYNTAELAPECNKITTVASDISKVLNYPRWYRWIREDKIKNAISSYVGWLTTPRNKPELIGRFRDALIAWTVIVRCDEDIDEMYDFVEVEEGTERFAAIQGSQDDTTMSHLITYYVSTQLRPRYNRDDAARKPEGKDFQNSDYSPVYDKPEAQNRDSVDYDCL